MREIIFFSQDHSFSRIYFTILVRSGFFIFRPVTRLGFRTFLGNRCGFFIPKLGMFSNVHIRHGSAEFYGNVIGIWSVYGMNKSVIDAGLADAIVGMDEIATTIAEITKLAWFYPWGSVNNNKFHCFMKNWKFEGSLLTFFFPSISKEYTFSLRITKKGLN